MTLVTKKIKGHCYYYFQDSLSRRETPITTYIGKKTLSDWLLGEEVQDAIKRHFLALPESKERQYFRYPPTDPDYTSKYLNHLRDNYILIKNNYAGEMEIMSRELFVKYVHTTNAIENNTLSESEVSLYLYSDIPPKDKLQNELQQTRNHLSVKSYLDVYNRPIDASLVKSIHKLMMKNVDDYNDYDDRPGRYRSNMVVIGDSNRQVPKPEDVPKLIKKLVNNYYHDLDQNIHPIECMAIFHHGFERIHPFRDGNGRTGRAILDYMLRLHRFPPIYIPLKLRETYFSALKEANVISNYTPLINFVVSRIIATLMFVSSRTSVKYLMLSKELERSFSKKFGENTYKTLASAITFFASHPEDP